MNNNVRKGFRPQIRSRHPSHSPLRLQLPRLPFRSIVRFGSSTELEDGKKRVELNTVESIKISSNKLRMKEKFLEARVKSAHWWTFLDRDADLGILFYDDSNWKNKQEDLFTSIEELPYPIVAKHHYGSRGTGNTLIKSQEELENWMRGKTLSNYIFEKFHNYGHEFRLHVSKNGCFYTCRKALKQDVPEKDKWHFHDDTCVWFMEDNEKFFKPNSWNDIVKDCMNALKAIGADFLAFDVKVQSPTTSKGKVREYQEYILLESNSAPSHGEVTTQKYLEEIPKLLKDKFVNNE